jgi:uncharacterized protein (DUF697 family)
MNQPLFLHIVEKLEGFLSKLPPTIQKPILHELTPLKELFLQQRSPRFILLGSSKVPLQEILPVIFGFAPEQDREVLMEIFRWHHLTIHGHGVIAVLDARGADESALANIRDELKTQPADIFFFIDDADAARPPRKREIDNLSELLELNDKSGTVGKVVGISLSDSIRHRAVNGSEKRAASEKESKLRSSLEEKTNVPGRIIEMVQLSSGETDPANERTRHLISLLARNLPNQARIEMLRISRDRAAQTEVAQTLVKSTTAICAAIGAQPIPLADLPILTTLQLVMVSGIMYLSGRERSLRAATEFVAALGANVGAGMLLREGARAVLKFFPGWGNVVCGMVAGAGTYAMGRAAIVYFVEGLSLKEAKQTYITSRKKRSRRERMPSLPGR